MLNVSRAYWQPNKQAVYYITLMMVRVFEFDNNVMLAYPSLLKGGFPKMEQLSTSNGLYSSVIHYEANLLGIGILLPYDGHWVGSRPKSVPDLSGQ